MGTLRPRQSAKRLRQRQQLYSVPEDGSRAHGSTCGSTQRPAPFVHCARRLCDQHVSAEGCAPRDLNPEPAD